MYSACPGGKDSIYASHILKEKYKMNPLTITWSPSLYTIGVIKISKLINTGSDNILFTPSGKTHRLLTRLAREFTASFQPFILGQKTLAAKIARMYKVPFFTGPKPSMEIPLMKLQLQK